MNKRSKMEANRISLSIYEYYKARNVETNCLRSFEEVVVGFAMDEVNKALKAGCEFSKARFNAVGNSVYKVIRDAYAIHIEENY